MPHAAHARRQRWRHRSEAVNDAMHTADTQVQFAVQKTAIRYLDVLFLDSVASRKWPDDWRSQM